MADKPEDAVPPVPVPPVEPAPQVRKAAAPKTPAATPPPPPAYQAHAYVPAAAGPAQGLSLTSMILGIAGVVLSFFAFGFLPALAAVITGHLAQRRQPHAKPFWLTGIITGYVGLAISVATFVIFIAFVIFAATTTYSYYG
ncbi:MAG: DUF4190 domain-containing protein [Rhodoglobus sp.]